MAWAVARLCLCCVWVLSELCLSCARVCPVAAQIGISALLCSRLCQHLYYFWLLGLWGMKILSLNNIFGHKLIAEVGWGERQRAQARRREREAERRTVVRGLQSAVSSKKRMSNENENSDHFEIWFLNFIRNYGIYWKCVSRLSLFGAYIVCMFRSFRPILVFVFAFKQKIHLFWPKKCMTRYGKRCVNTDIFHALCRSVRPELSWDSDDRSPSLCFPFIAK